MEKFVLFGKKSRCVWCGKSRKDKYKEIEFGEGKKNAKLMKVLVCSDKCERDLLKNEGKYKGKAPLFIVNLIVSVLLSIVGISLLSINYYFTLLCILSLFIFGITVFFLPFVTPQTVKLMGYKMGLLIGRITGVVLILCGIALIGFIMFGNNPV